MRAFLVLAMVVTCLVVSTAVGTTIFVDDNAPYDPGPGDPAVSDPQENGTSQHPYDAIAEGIAAASDGDEVVVRAGLYSGSGNRDLDFHGKLITVRGTEGPLNTIIECEGAGRGVSFTSGETAAAVLEGLTIRNGLADQGGGIYVNEASPTIRDCRIIGNRATEDGGGLQMSTAGGLVDSVTLIDCVISGNQAEWLGGGVSGWKTGPNMINCIVSGNRSRTGGGLDCQSGLAAGNSFTLVGCRFCGNVSSDDGGAVNAGGLSPTLINCMLVGNLSGRDGGGISSGGTNTCRVLGCSLIENAASGAGGGVFLRYGYHAELSNTVVWGNMGWPGSAILVGEDCELTVRHCDVLEYYVQDVDTFGNGVLNWGAGNINSDPLFRADLTGSWTADGAFNAATGHVTFTDESASWYPGQLVGWLLYPVHVEVPQFVVVSNTATTVTILADWPTIDAGVSPVMAGSTYRLRSYALGAGSPCIDAGDNALVPADSFDLDGDLDVSEPTPLDLAGYPRFEDDLATIDTGAGTPPIVDIGTYEYSADADHDGYADEVDNCPYVSNNQSDTDGDGVGTVCDRCEGYRDDLDCNTNGRPDGCDILLGVSLDYTANGIPDECEQCDLDGDGDADQMDEDLFAGALGSTSGDPEYLPEADHDADGMITAADYASFLRCARRTRGDYDGDGDTDQADFGFLQRAYTGEGAIQADLVLVRADLDSDSDVDQNDCERFSRCLSGSGVATDSGCAAVPAPSGAE